MSAMPGHITMNHRPHYKSTSSFSSTSSVHSATGSVKNGKCSVLGSFFSVLRPRSRKQKSLAWFCFIISVQLAFIYIYKTTSTNLKQVAIVQQQDSEDAAVAADRNGCMYNHLVDAFDVEDFKSQDLHSKSKLYFDALYHYNPGWSVSTLGKTKYYKKLSAESDFRAYYRRECEREWARLNVKDKEEKKKICSVIRSTILDNWRQNKKIENEIYNSVGHLKMYNNAVLKAGLDFKEAFPDLEQRLFPFLDQQVSVASLLRGSAGRGVVFSTGDSQVDNLIRTIKVLRFLRNDLPLQVVHRGELSPESVKRIEDACSDQISEANPAQQISVIDVKPLVSADYDIHFKGSMSKLLASVFNTFEEFVFMDNDAVLFKSPESFFQYETYKSTGAYFFRDRDFANQGLNKQILGLLKSLMPSKDIDHDLFEVPELDADSVLLQNNFFKGLTRHFVDSGLFVMSKASHLGGLLCSMHLSTWTPTAHFVYGDKELFWLGQAMVGNGVSVSENAAAVSGELKSYSETTEQICSSQITHLDPQTSGIVWMNGGADYCNLGSSVAQTDLSLSPYKGRFKDAAELAHFYRTPIPLVNAAILPADELKEHPNKDQQPIKNWEFVPELGCNNRFFCSFEAFGPLDDTVNNRVVHFDEPTQKIYHDIISVWNDS